MITKHIISNEISTRGEKDTALPPLRLMEKEKMLTREKRPGTGIEPREGSCLKSDRHNRPSPQILTTKMIKRTTAVSPLAPRCWHLPSPGESEDFNLARPPPPPTTVTPAPSPDTRGRRRRRRTPCPLWLMLFPLARRRRQRLRLSPPLEQQYRRAGYPLGMPPSSSTMLLPNKSAEAKAPASAPAISFGADSLWSAATSAPAGCCLVIVHSLLIRHRNVPTIRQRRQIIPTIFLILSTTTLKIVGGSGSP